MIRHFNHESLVNAAKEVDERQMELLIQNLSMSYGKTKIFSDLNATLHDGGLIGLLGPNGAGKTTLLKILTTLQKPTKGDVLIDGTSMIAHPNVMKNLLGYLPQQVPYFPNLTAGEYLNYIAGMKGMKAKEARRETGSLLERLHLADTGHKRLKDFSGGMRQRVGIAATLLNDPKIIIADEPSTGLDPEERVTLRNILGELANDHLVLLSTHIVSDVEAIAGQILLIKEGYFLYQGTPSDLIKRSIGHVWEYPVTTADTSPLTAKQLEVPTNSLIQRPDGIQIREIAKTPRQPQARQVLPSLEEAYLGALKGVISL